ncbi:hypothetical protein [Pseudonocardia nigra]|uniref:hypothetical protein n=1 Tax=Pseudonocardia nigra TaxID=1921578 RepID=UPI001C5FDAD9|nr:hypothetical protein [Pseudonocardia nigra]
MDPGANTRTTPPSTSTDSLLRVTRQEHDPTLRRRVYAPAPRRAQVAVRFSEDELAAVRDCARRDGLAIGAWLGELAVRVADRNRSVVPMRWRDTLRELVQERAELERVVQSIREFGAEDAQRVRAEQALRRLDLLIEYALAATERDQQR